MDNTYQRLRTLFEQCAEMPEGDCARWIEQHIADSDLRIELELMLAADRADVGFLHRDVAARIDHLGSAAEREFEPDSLIGRRFGAFELQRLLGQGGQGTVYLAHRIDSDFAQTAAVKLLRRGIHDRSEHRRFRREREILAGFDHPGVSRLIDGGVSGDGVPYLIMEYVNGVPIDRWCAEQSLDLRSRVELIAQLCEVVAAAHRALIVHRDLKPSNVLVSGDGDIKVLDFGIARLLDEDGAHTQTLVPLMTPGYGAPEQARGGAITLATDVHALGMLLRLLLTGIEPPTSPGQPASLPGTLRPELRWIISKACAVEAERRYRDAAELGDDLGRFLDARPVLAHPPSRWYTTRKFVHRHRGGVLTSAVVLLGILTSAGVAIWQAKVAREQTALASEQARRAEATRDFLLSVFEAAKEDLPRDVRPTPDVLVRAAARKLEGDSQLSAPMRAEFLGTLAKISFISSDYKQAIDYADGAIAALDAIGAADTRQHLGLEVIRAEALGRLNRHEEADGVLERRINALRSQDDEVAAEGVRVFAITRRRTGHLDDALNLAREAADRARQLYAADSDAVEEAVLSYGFELSNSGKTDQAIALFEQRRADWSKHHASRDRNYSALIQNLAYLKHRTGKMQEAESLMRESLELTRSIHQPPSEDIASASHNLGVLLAGVGRYDEAEPLLRDAATMYAELFGPNHSQTITALGMQGAVENKRGHFAEALPRLLDATAACTTAKLDSDPACAYNWHYLSLTYLKLGRLDEADAAIDRNVELRLKLYGETNPEYAKALITKGDILIARGKPDAAMSVLAQAQAIFNEHGQQDSLSSANVFSAQARALVALRRGGEALTVVEQEDALLQRIAPKDEARRLDMLISRAESLSQLERAGEARDAARAALKLESSKATVDAVQWQRMESLAR